MNFIEITTRVFLKPFKLKIFQTVTTLCNIKTEQGQTFRTKVTGRMKQISLTVSSPFNKSSFEQRKP